MECVEFLFLLKGSQAADGLRSVLNWEASRFDQLQFVLTLCIGTCNCFRRRKDLQYVIFTVYCIHFVAGSQLVIITLYKSFSPCVVLIKPPAGFVTGLDGVFRNVPRAAMLERVHVTWILSRLTPTPSSSLTPTAFATTSRASSGSIGQKTPFRGAPTVWTPQTL